MAKSSGDRLRSARLLIRVENGAFASRLLDLDPSPGGRVRLLGVLRWQRALDHAVAPFLKRPLARLDPEVRTALRLGVFEARYLGVPPAVATDAMVRLTRRLGKTSAAGMVNAVLRRAAAADDRIEPSPDLKWSHPEWLWRRWVANFGAVAAEGAMAAAQEPAPPWVWLTGDPPSNRVGDPPLELERHPWCPGAWTATEERARLMRRAGRGEVVVQDPSSQMVARFAVSAAGGHGRVVDLCAAPGGKTALIRELGCWEKFIAADRSPAKAGRLSRRLVAVPVIAADASRPALAAAAWDLVLLDSPCSGTGTFRRHPELKWRLESSAITDAARRQRSMIDGALDLLAPGGVLIYATCSVEPEENEAHFETIPAGYEPVEPGAHLPDDAPWSETAAGGARILPHEHGDGFTVHSLKRKE